jgi:hypothetical protein
MGPYVVIVLLFGLPLFYEWRVPWPVPNLAPFQILDDLPPPYTLEPDKSMETFWKKVVREWKAAVVINVVFLMCFKFVSLIVTPHQLMQPYNRNVHVFRLFQRDF